jgi:hypothetical protein
MMMTNIIVTGCSYSQISGVKKAYPNMLDSSLNLKVSNLAWPGQSNDTIIRNVKEQIRGGISDTLFICQLTHLHRVSHYCTLNKKWLDFQPAIVNIEPTIKDDKVSFEIETHTLVPPSVYGAQRWSDSGLDKEEMYELFKWYEFYLTHLYDEENTFHELTHKINELTKQVKDSGNDILYLYWPDISYDDSLFLNNNFLSIDGEYSMLKWSIKNKLTQPQDTHLTVDGHIAIMNEICKHLNIPYTPYVQPII